MSIPRADVRKSLSIVPKTDLVARLFVPEDYPEYSKWWSKWNMTPPVPRLLSRTGIMVTRGERRDAAGFVYVTNSPTAMICWVCVNPAISRGQRDDSLTYFIGAADNFMRAQGTEVSILVTGHSMLLARTKLSGYHRVDDGGVTFMIKDLIKPEGE